MAGDDWQSEAVRDQFDVFNKIFEPCSSFNATDLREIINKVGLVMKQQLRVKRNTTAPVRNISMELIKALPEQENNLHMSYVVVVTNEAVNGKLSKIPVFRVLVKNQHTYVDVSGSVYKTWDAFMKNNDLPACKFCYPVDGCYDVKKKLEVDFALSPAASWSKKYFWFVLVVGVICAGVVAYSFFYSIPPTALRLCSKLISIAKLFLPKIVSDIMRYSEEFVNLGNLFRKGEKTAVELSLCALEILFKFYCTFKEQIFLMWEETKKVLCSVYNYLCRIFDKYFKKAPSGSQQNFFAIVLKVEKEMSEAVEEAGAELDEMYRLIETNHVHCITNWAIKKWLGVPCALVTSQTVPSVIPLPYKEQIFQNCPSQSALLHEIKNPKNEYDNDTHSQPLTPTVKELLSLSEKVANELGVETLTEVKDIFESLSCIVKGEYKYKIDTYIKGVRAAKVATGCAIDLHAYNNSLGIEGDPKDHYMKEAMHSIQESRLALRLKEKVKEIQMSRKIFLIPVYKKSEGGVEGVYKTIGVQGKGKFSAQMLLKVLKESFLQLEESTLVVNETNSVIYIRSEEISIFAYQEVNNDNTSEGIVYVNKC